MSHDSSRQQYPYSLADELFHQQGDIHVLLSTPMKNVVAVLLLVYNQILVRRGLLRLVSRYLDEWLLRQLLAKTVSDGVKHPERSIHARRQHTERRGI